jgi:hypothetical protein
LQITTNIHEVLLMPTALLVMQSFYSLRSV